MGIAVTDAAMRGSGVAKNMPSGKTRWIGPRDRGQALLTAITADDSEYFEAHLLDVGDNQVELIIEVNAETLASLRATMDDLLACLSAVETSLDVIQN